MTRLFFLLLLASTSAYADIEANREVTQTFANYFIAEKNYRRAKSHLIEHLRADPKDEKSWNLLGLVQMRLGQNETASKAFLKASKATKQDSKKRATYLYNYADALTRQGNLPKAKKTLAYLKRNDRLSDAAEEALSVIQSGRALPPLRTPKPGQVSLSLSVRPGYDTNVLLTPEASLSSVSASQRGGFGTGFYVQGGYTKPFTASQAFAKGTVAHTQYFNNNIKQYNNLILSGSLGWERPRPFSGRYAFGAPNRFDYILLNSSGLKGYSWTNTLSPYLQFHHNSRSDTKLNVDVYYQRYLGTAAVIGVNDRGGFGFRPSLIHSHQVGKFDLSGGIEFERHLSRGINFKATTYKFPLKASHPLPFRVRGTLGFEPARIFYPDSSNRRADTYFQASASFSRTFARKVFGTLEYAFTKNNSTLTSSIYEKHTVGILVNYLVF